MHRIPDLLQYAKTLCVYEDKLAHAQGDRFNIFELLGVASREVSTHTPYLAEFLDPKGVHGLGEFPLKTFIRLFRLDKLIFNPTNAKVKREYYLGPKFGDKGGRIDILLTDSATGQQIAIENKIYASDQEDQLWRYHNSLPKALLVYITPDGRKPAESSTREMPTESIVRLSYERDIIAWQEECRRQAAAAPLVRETITQYINLLKRLTNQNTNTRMSTEIAKKILNDSASLAAYYELAHAGDAVRLEIVARLHKRCDKIANDLGLQLEFQDNELRNKHGSFTFISDELKSQNIGIRFQFDAAEYRNFLFGVCYLNPNDSNNAQQNIIKRFKDAFAECEENEWWAAVSEWDNHYYNWDEDTFADIEFGDFKATLEEKVKQLLAIVRAS